MTTARFDRRRFLGGAALLGVSAVMSPAGLVALRRTERPGSPDLTHAGQRSHPHPSHPILPTPRYVTVVQTHRTPAGVPYLAAVALPLSGD